MHAFSPPILYMYMSSFASSFFSICLRLPARQSPNQRVDCMLERTATLMPLWRVALHLSNSSPPGVCVCVCVFIDELLILVCHIIYKRNGQILRCSNLRTSLKNFLCLPSQVWPLQESCANLEAVGRKIQGKRPCESGPRGLHTAPKPLPPLQCARISHSSPFPKRQTRA